MNKMLKSVLGLAFLLASTGSPASWDLEADVSRSVPKPPLAASTSVYAPALATPETPASAPRGLSVLEVVNAMIAVAEPDAPLLTAIDPAKAHARAKAAKAGPKAPLPIPAPPAIWLLAAGILLGRVGSGWTVELDHHSRSHRLR